jgi:hypothetical protein
LKTGILRETRFVSSVREKVGQFNLNCIYAKEFVHEVLDFAEEATTSLKQQHQDNLQLIESLPKDFKQKVLDNIGLNFAAESEKCFKQIEKWVSSWAHPQVLSIVQREVFAKDRKELEEILKQSKEKIVAGFKALVQSRMPAPFAELDRLMSIMQHEIQLVTFMLQ